MEFFCPFIAHSFFIICPFYKILAFQIIALPISKMII
nr:MAG TPA: hypothetical protein [Caudoviricetes sp.]DAQ31212.1 MAG TPA: hypothetical protein [Caudoviricetes sp.]